MPKKLIVSDNKLDKLIKYYNQGLKIKDISEKLNLNQSWINTYLFKYKISNRRKNRVSNNEKLTKEIQALIAKGYSNSLIYKQLGITRGLYYFLCKKINTKYD